MGWKLKYPRKTLILKKLIDKTGVMGQCEVGIPGVGRRIDYYFREYKTAVELQEKDHEKNGRIKVDDHDRTQLLDAIKHKLFNIYIDDPNFDIDAEIDRIADYFDEQNRLCPPLTLENMKKEFADIWDDKGFAKKFGLPLVDEHNGDGTPQFRLFDFLKKLRITEDKWGEFEGLFHNEDDANDTNVKIDNNGDEWDEVVEVKPIKNVKQKNWGAHNVVFKLGIDYVIENGEIMVTSKVCDWIAIRAGTEEGWKIFELFCKFKNYIKKYLEKQAEKIKDNCGLINDDKLNKAVEVIKEKKIKKMCQEYKIKYDKEVNKKEKENRELKRENELLKKKKREKGNDR